MQTPGELEVTDVRPSPSAVTVGVNDPLYVPPPGRLLIDGLTPADAFAITNDVDAAERRWLTLPRKVAVTVTVPAVVWFPT